MPRLHPGMIDSCQLLRMKVSVPEVIWPAGPKECSVRLGQGHTWRALSLPLLWEKGGQRLCALVC